MLLKPSELLIFTLLRDESGERWEKVDVNTWESALYHCEGCGEFDQITDEEAETRFGIYELLAVPVGVAEWLAKELISEYNRDWQGTVSYDIDTKIVDAIESVAKGWERA